MGQAGVATWALLCPEGIALTPTGGAVTFPSFKTIPELARWELVCPEWTGTVLKEPLLLIREREKREECPDWLVCPDKQENTARRSAID